MSTSELKVRNEVDVAEPRRTSIAVIVGLVAIVVAFIGIGALHALQQPPFLPTDETAHVGYAQEIASFRLPQIREFPEVPVEARQWQAERSMANDIRYRGVWVANHPPLHYMAVAPLVWASRAVGAPDGGLILMRFANVAFAAVGLDLHVPARVGDHPTQPSPRVARRSTRCARAPGARRLLAGPERWVGVRGRHGRRVGRRSLPAAHRRLDEA